MKAIGTALGRTPAETNALQDRWVKLHDSVHELDEQLNGVRSKEGLGERKNPTVGSRLFAVARGISNSTYGPTANHKRDLGIAQTKLNEVEQAFKSIDRQLSALANDIVAAGGPWVEGEALPKE